MKIGIMSDTHLSAQKYNKVDRKTGENKFFLRQFKSFEWALDYLKEHNINTIVHAGDLYDSSKVTVYPIKRTKELLKNFNMYAIKGNHDDNNFLHEKEISALDLTGIHSINKPESNTFEEVNIVFIPWNYEVDTSMLKDDKYNILIMHQYPKEYQFSKQELHKDNYEKSKKFDLVITGHYHNVEDYVKDGTRYLNPGSSLAAFGNANDVHEPSIWIFDTKTKEIERVKIPNAIQLVTKDVKDPDQFLTDIKKEDIYRLSVESMPEKKNIMKAKKIALELQFKLQEKKDIKIEKEVDNFWMYVKKKKPAYEQSFKNVLNV